MEPHHAESLHNVVRHFETDPSIQALILGSTITHGFARPDSDLDLALAISAEEFARHRAENRMPLPNHTLRTYPGGYVDAKYMDLDGLRDTEQTWLTGALAIDESCR